MRLGEFGVDALGLGEREAIVASSCELPLDASGLKIHGDQKSALSLLQCSHQPHHNNKGELSDCSYRFLWLFVKTRCAPPYSSNYLKFS